MRLQKILEDNKILDQYKSRELIELTCDQCDCSYKRAKNFVQAKIKRGYIQSFCSLACTGENQKNRIECKCKNCKKTFQKKHNQFKRTKNHFCSLSCSASFNNSNKTYGFRRSKIEIMIEKHLSKKYPKLKIGYNDKTLGSELDLYIPSLKLAFEINGIVHYEPIFGMEKLIAVRKNDGKKKRICDKNGVKLHIINVSKIKHLTHERAMVVINRIIRRIEFRMVDTHIRIKRM